MFGWFKTVGHYERKFQRMYNAPQHEGKSIWQRLNELNPFKFKRNGDKKNSNEADCVTNSHPSWWRLPRPEDRSILYLASKKYETAKNNQRWAGWRSEGKKRLGYARFIQGLMAKESSSDVQSHLKAAKSRQHEWSQTQELENKDTKKEIVTRCSYYNLPSKVVLTDVKKNFSDQGNNASPQDLVSSAEELIRTIKASRYLSLSDHPNATCTEDYLCELYELLLSYCHNIAFNTQSSRQWIYDTIDKILEVYEKLDLS